MVEPSYMVLYKKYQESIDGCIKCGLCLSICPVFKAIKGEKYAGPRYLSAELGRHLMEYAPVAYDGSYLCTICRHCEFACPSNVATPAAVLFLRKLLADIKPKGKPAADVMKALEEMMKLGNPYATPGDMKGEWLEEIGGTEGGKAEVVGWVGCTASIRLPELAQGFYEAMKAALGDDFTVLGSKEWCCGKPAFLLGGAEAAKSLAEESIRRIKEVGAHTLVTPCPACYSAFKYEHAEIYGVSEPITNVKHVAEFFKELLDKGAIVFKEPEGIPKKIIYHDPCELGRGLGIYEEPRIVLSAIPGIELLEFDDNRQDSLCCGGGGGMWGIYPEVSMATAALRLKEAVKKGAEAIVSACPACFMNFKYTVLNYEIPIKVLDISQVVAKAISKKV